MSYTTEVLDVTDMLQNADNKLFSLMFRSGHCLHTLLPDLKMIGIVLRSSGTSFNWNCVPALGVQKLECLATTMMWYRAEKEV